MEVVGLTATSSEALKLSHDLLIFVKDSLIILIFLLSSGTSRAMEKMQYYGSQPVNYRSNYSFDAGYMVSRIVRLIY